MEVQNSGKPAYIILARSLRSFDLKKRTLFLWSKNFNSQENIDFRYYTTIATQHRQTPHNKHILHILITLQHSSNNRLIVYIIYITNKLDPEISENLDGVFVLVSVSTSVKFPGLDIQEISQSR